MYPKNLLILILIVEENFLLVEERPVISHYLLKIHLRQKKYIREEQLQQMDQYLVFQDLKLFQLTRLLKLKVLVQVGLNNIFSPSTEFGSW